MADPEFPRGGCANPQGGGANLLFGQITPQNCMKMKEFGPRGDHVPSAHLDLPMHLTFFFDILLQPPQSITGLFFAICKNNLT